MIDLSYSGTSRVAAPSSVPSESEQAKGLNLEVIPVLNGLTGFVNTKLIKSSNAESLWSINISGGLYDADQSEWIIPHELSLTIQTDIASNPVGNSELFLNSSRESGPAPMSITQTGLGSGKIKLYVMKDGIYRIYYDSLSHIDVVSDENIQSRTLKLVYRGEVQSIYVDDGGDGFFDRGDFFDFIGQQKYFDGTSQYYDAFTDINVYWLDWGGSDGLRFIEESGALIDSDPVRPNTFWDVSHIEYDNNFERLGQVDTDLPSITRDHYFWESVNSGVTKEVEFFLADPFRGSSENVQVSVGLHGLTYSETAGEVKSHTLFAFMNDNSIGDGSWIQQEEYVLNSPSALNLSHNILSATGENRLSIFAPVSTEPGNYDKIVLNWIEIGYEHRLRASNEQLRFRKSFINPATSLEFEVQGFTSHNLVAYKAGISKITGFTIRENWDAALPEYSLVFQDVVTDATPDYWVSSQEGLLNPVAIVPDTSANLRSLNGDFIVIAIPAFMDDLDEYLEFKQNEGWNPISVSVADIYDEFNHGINSPFAIKDFLRYAQNHWPDHPEHVLFLGDAISNPQQAKRDTRIRNVPTFYMQTYGWGAAEADYWYTLINGEDYLPDLHVGRIPCNDEEDLSSTLTKLIRYGSNDNYGAWQSDIITIAGFDSTFKFQSESLLQNSIPKAYQPSRIFIDRDSEGQVFWGDTDSLVEQWNNGKVLINFVGHGGGAVWADRSLFVRDDINYLNEDTPPAFVTSMTCFTASFAQARGLGEVVMTESPTGAIGWFGSSGVGWIINDYLMIQPLLRRLLEDRKTVGEIINIARMEYFLANSGYDYLKPSMLFQYNYLGDPTTRLKLPEPQHILESWKPIYASNEQLEFSYSGDAQGVLKLLPVNSSGRPWWSTPREYQTAQVQDFLIDQEVGASSGVGRVIYSLDRGSDMPALHGYEQFSVSSDWFEHIPLTAEELTDGDLSDIRVRFHSALSNVDSMVIDISGANPSRTTMIRSGDWWSSPIVDLELLTSGNIYYSFLAFHQNAHIQTSPTFRLYLREPISLSVNGVRSGYKQNSIGIYIDYTLSGLSESDAQLSHFDSSASYHQGLNQTVALIGGNQSIFIPTFFGVDDVYVRSSLTIEGDITSNDNSIESVFQPHLYQILPGLGITFDGVARDSVRLWNGGHTIIQSNDSGWVSIETFNTVIPAHPGISLYQDSTVYAFNISNDDIFINIEASRQLFFKDNGLSTWQYLEPSETDKIGFKGSGLIALGQKQNFTPPGISMMIEGQLFFEGDYILSNSHLNLLAEDENGFSWSERHVKVLVDGTPVAIAFGDTTESGQIMSISAGLNLEVGEHHIAYTVSDALGNWSEEFSSSAVVAGEAEIIDYGNFPNPFEGETLIIYELTQPLDDVVIDIYTLAGYKLHSIDLFSARVSIPLGAIGYHELPWNGRDRYEDFVANGVYFYRIKGMLDGDELLGPIGKMVKNR